MRFSGIDVAICNIVLVLGIVKYEFISWKISMNSYGRVEY